MYGILGWLNVSLLAVMTAPYWLRFLNNHTLRLKGGVYGKAIKALRTIHKPLGAAIVLIALIHGFLALGALRVHTGSILWLLLFLTAIIGTAFFFTKKKGLFAWHKRMALVVIVFLLVHLLFPSAVYTLFH